MTNFVLNLNNIKDDLKNFKNNINNYKDSIIYLNLALNKVDSAWNDLNTNIFINIINKDKCDFLEHINSIKKYIDVISYFCDNIENYFEKKFFIDKVNKIKYDSDMLNKAIENLNNCYNKLNNITNILQNLEIPTDFKYKNLIENYCYDIDKYKNSILTLKSKFSRVNSDINNIINEIKIKRNCVDFKVINSQKIEYKWKNYGINKIKNIRGVKIKNKSAKKFNKKLKINISNSFDLKKVNLENRMSLHTELDSLEYRNLNHAFSSNNKISEQITNNTTVLNNDIGENKDNLKIDNIKNNIGNTPEKFNTVESSLETKLNNLEYKNGLEKLNFENNQLKTELKEIKNNSMMQNVNSSNKTININLNNSSNQT